MKKFVVKGDTAPELKELVNVLSEEYPISFSGEGIALEFEYRSADESSFECKISADGIKITYSTLAAAARGIGSALSGIECSENTPFKSLGIMLDVSRGMVMTVEHLKKWLRRLALSGCNMIMLYTEDTYRLENEPYFGRFRGAYSAQEIREIDSYAAKLGIEVIGCIQTLGHMEQILRWQNAYSDISDTGLDLLEGEEKTYLLIEKMIRFWAENLSSERIHIGMDETQQLGRGRHLTLNGYEDPFEILNRHLARVNDICLANGLKPMIWSDMYFRFNNIKHEYYDWSKALDKDVMARVPSDVELVYWDYYHKEEEPYVQMITRHREAGFEPVMASGIWTWPTLWYNHVQTMKTIVPCINVCRKEKIKELFFTMWGDDGAYCNYDSSLFGIIKAADLAFGAEDDEFFARRFEAVCRAEYLPAAAASEFGTLPYNAAVMIWDDPLMGIYYDEMLLREGETFIETAISQYGKMLEVIRKYPDEKNGGDMAHLVNILELLIQKMEFRRDFKNAYKQNDRVMLLDIAEKRIPALIEAVRKFDDSFRRQYLDCAKVFGLDRLQLRHGGLVFRLEETARRIAEYLDGKCSTIVEFEEPPVGELNTCSNSYGAVAAGSASRW